MKPESMVRLIAGAVWLWLSLAGCGGGTSPAGSCGDVVFQPPASWSWCPDRNAYVGGDWPWELEVTGDAIYCGTFDEARTLEEEYAKKGLLRIVPGSYPLPDQAGNYAFRLPLCLEFQETGAQPLLAGPGTLGASFNIYDGQLYYTFTLLQPLETASGEPWELRADFHGVMPPGQTQVTVDGSYLGILGPDSVFFGICRGSCELYDDWRGFGSCRFESANPQLHTVDFQGGQARFLVRMGQSMASTEPALFACASGELDGQGFAQADYWKLIYNPTHHHFTRDFAVLFDRPIFGACGLKAVELEPFGEPPLPLLSTVACDLSELESRLVTGERFEFQP